MVTRFLIAGLMLLLGGCSSLVTVKSDPAQADVFFLDPKSGEKKLLGKTPLEMTDEAIRKTTGDELLSGEFFALIVEKQGYATEKFMIPATRFGTLLTSLDVKLKQGAIVKEDQVARDILNHLFLAQRLAVSRQYERAQVEVDKILAIIPEFPRALSMRASIFYVQKNYVESLKWYEAALKADPQMEDAVQMTAKIRTIQSGGRVPASGAAPNQTGKR